MEWNPQTVEYLCQCFLQTVSPERESRCRTESHLSEAANHYNFGLFILRLVAEPSIDNQIRLAAAVSFKNHLQLRWLSKDNPILESEKEHIKTLIVSLMLSATAKIQSQLSEALAIIGDHDFPEYWPSLLPELISNLHKSSQASDYVSINGILTTVNSIFRKFCVNCKTNYLLDDLKYCLDNFAAPLLEIFLKTASLIDAAAVAVPAPAAAIIRPLFESQKLCCWIFHSLNSQELPEFFEDHMKEWMTEFGKYLTNSYPFLEGCGPDGLALVDELRVAVCENINLYMVKYEEEFKEHLSGFAQDVWNLLRNVSQSSGRDQLAVTAIKFLTTVSTSVHHALFAADATILLICQGIVIPNVMLREDDEEQFEMDPMEYIRKDMEGSDLDTRRRIACDLLKGIAMHYGHAVRQIVSTQIQSLLSSFAENPVKNWRHKDCAIYLVISLSTKIAGTGYVSIGLVDFQSFFEFVIVPELQSLDVNGYSMLKAGALKYFTMFLSQISKDVALMILGDLVRFINAESNVVHSYAAICIEKLVLVKEEGGRQCYSSADIAPIFPMLLNNLFGTLKNAESDENQYVMKCILTVLGVEDIPLDHYALICIEGLGSLLSEVSKNPRNPIFNQYLFESVAILVKRGSERDPSLVSVFETRLFPRFDIILKNGVTEFLPYTFQLLALLVGLNRPPIPPIYMQIFECVLSPHFWKSSANIPALLRLLQVFLQKAPNEISQVNELNKLQVISENVDPANQAAFLQLCNTFISH
ncbi:putative armadillo-like helical protein [Medicago truncatula]|uniref:Importin-alpha re-exporter, putative n=1 Tax=Medicago truncatula TaxID=3880 RepID=G7KL09_MEDTR|nr:exportin-2 [Medicago truncatula]AES75588.1 importin-alpha re-exporter, putative [Medicago truncatula]RHN51530.1 putative armadillo-like helical protein [Medicago truncatula]